MPRSRNFISMFSSRSFMVSYLTFKPLLHLGLSFVDGIRYRSSFIIWVLMSNYPSTIYWKNCLCSLSILDFLVKYSVQSLSRVQFFGNPGTAASHASLSTNSRACSNSCPLSWWYHPTIFVLCCPLLLLPSVFPSIRNFSNESLFTLPKYWGFSFRISPS